MRCVKCQTKTTQSAKTVFIDQERIFERRNAFRTVNRREVETEWCLECCHNHRLDFVLSQIPNSTVEGEPFETRTEVSRVVKDPTPWFMTVYLNTPEGTKVVTYATYRRGVNRYERYVPVHIMTEEEYENNVAHLRGWEQERDDYMRCIKAPVISEQNHVLTVEDLRDMAKEHNIRYSGVDKLGLFLRLKRSGLPVRKQGFDELPEWLNAFNP